MKFTLKEMTLSALFAAFTAICAQISIPIPFSPVPLTLSLFAVFMSAVILGPKYGSLSQVIYVLLGTCGAPVFAGFMGGFGVVAGFKGGYILSYPVIALVIGLILKKKPVVSRMDMIGAMVIGLILCYTMGATWLGFVLKKTVAESITLGVAPFLPLDILKIVLVSVIGYQVRNSLIKAKLLSVS